MEYLITDFTLKIFLIVKCTLSSMHIEALKDLKYSLPRKWKQTITFWKLLWIFGKWRKRHEKVKSLKRSSWPSNKDQWQKQRIHVTPREGCHSGRPGKTNERHRTGNQELIGPDCLENNNFFCKSLTYILPEGFLSRKTPLCWSAQNRAWEREIIGRQLLWASSPLPEAKCCSPVKWRAVGRAGLSILIPYPSLGPVTHVLLQVAHETGGTEHKAYCFLCFLDLLKHPSSLLLFFKWHS